MACDNRDKIDAEILLENINNADKGDAEKKDTDREFDHPEENMNGDYKNEQHADSRQKTVHQIISHSLKCRDPTYRMAISCFIGRGRVKKCFSINPLTSLTLDRKCG